MERFALKNKREIWKTQAKVSYFRQRAKDLARTEPAEQEVLFKKLQTLGLATKTIADVLALRAEDLLQRRLPTVIFKKGYAQTPQQARQLVTHRKVSVNGVIVTIPSYLVHVAEESTIKVAFTLQAKQPKGKKAIATEVETEARA